MKPNYFQDDDYDQDLDAFDHEYGLPDDWEPWDDDDIDLVDDDEVCDD